MMRNPRYANEQGGILLDYDEPDLPSLYVDQDSPDAALWSAAVAGEFGPVRPHTPRLEPDPLEAKRQPAALSRMEFKLALHEAGLLDGVEAAISDPATPRRLRIMWADASQFERNHPDLVALAAQMGYTDEQMDAVFGIATGA